jgi:hypothetical protein
LKQNLKIETFAGTSASAVKIQNWTALIIMPILRHLRLNGEFDWSLSNPAAILRMNLLAHRDLWIWFDHPYECRLFSTMQPQAELPF